jgi:hypothetical protein
MINKNSSRLKETDFSNHNLRNSYVDSQVEYLAALRDSVIFDNYGVQVLVRVPVNEFDQLLDNYVDEYSNFVNDRWIETTETVVPLFKEYREVLSSAGMTADGTDAVWPLEVQLPSRLHIPRDSRIVFGEYDCEENQIAREWVVLGTVMKQLSDSKTYTRIARCVPSRQVLVNSANTYEGVFWFKGEQKSPLLTGDIRSQGTLWFDNTQVLSVKVCAVTEDEDNSGSDAELPEVLDRVVKLTPYIAEACFSGKRVSISVLY